jgi:hypothetical protein
MIEELGTLSDLTLEAGSPTTGNCGPEDPPESCGP